MGDATLLACDWGTTNLRAWTLDAEGKVVDRGDFQLGVSRLAAGEAAQRFEAEVRPRLHAQDLPAILCGMIGSTLGWISAPYVDCPADPAALAGAAIDVGQPARPVRILPGARCAGLAHGVDVMRGEETQLAGWLSLDERRRTGRRIVCHPGTHAKWMLVEDGRLTHFVTAMTGELFAVLGSHSVLRCDQSVTDEDAFEEGLAASGDGGGLAARLFTTRARVVGGGKSPESRPAICRAC